MRQLLIILLLIPLFSLGQADLLPEVAWRTYVRNVEQLTDSTYKFEVMPLDWNQPGAANIDYGNYFQDYGGNKYEVIDSSYLSVTVKDIFEHGVSPQVDRIGLMFQSPFDSKYLATIPYQYLDETALDNSRAIELAYLWRQANLYAQDSAYLVWWNDTIQDIATKYDIDTLNQKTLDSLLIHWDYIKNLESDLPNWATSIEAQAGVDTTKMMNPKRTSEQITLNQMPYYGALENLYSDYNLQGDTGVFNNLKLLDGYNVGYYLKVDDDGVIIAEAISGALVYQGTWQASTNTPTLVDGTGTNGYYYRVVNDGTVNFGSGDITFEAGDDVLYNGTIWERIPGVGYTLQAATSTHLGGVKIGENVDVDIDGVISVDLSHLAGKDTLAYYVLKSVYEERVSNLSDSIFNHEGRIVTLEAFTESDPRYAADSSYIKSNIWDWLNSIAYGITGTDTAYWNNKVDDVSGIETNVQTLLDSLNYYLLTTDFNDSIIVLRSEIPTLLTELDSTGFTLKEAQISDLKPYLLEADLQPLKDTIKINSDSIDVLAGLIADIETIAELATVLEAQAGVSDKLMTALRTAEQLTLNAVPYYNVKEDIYSNFDATFDSIFASNLYQENISVDATGTGGVYDKEVSTDNIEVYLNGVLQREGVDFSQNETHITFIRTPLTDDYVTIKYKQ